MAPESGLIFGLTGTKVSTGNLKPIKVVDTGDGTFAIVADIDGGQVGDISPDTAEVHGTDSVSSTPEEGRVGSSNLANRQYLMVTPRDGDLRWGLANTITVSAGHLLKKDETGVWKIGATLNVFFIATTGTVAYDISEIS